MFEELLDAAYDKLAQAASDAKDIANYFSTFDGNIAHAVGKSSKNDAKDVLTVRLLLNGHIVADTRMKPLTALDLDQPINPGNSMDPTITAIIWFQKHVAGFNNPDGKISPNQRTHTVLKGLDWKKKGKSRDTHAEIGAKPLALTEAQVGWYKPGGILELNYYGFPPGSVVRAGETWFAVDGERIIYQAGHTDVIYTLLKPRNNTVRPGTYIQQTKWFAKDIGIGAVAGEVARRCEMIRVLALIECEFFIGLGCALYLPAALFIMTMEVGPFVMNNYGKFPFILNLLLILPDLIAFMAKNTPTLLKFIIWSIVYKLMDHMGDSANDPRKVARLAGGMIGKLGMAGFESTVRSLGYALGVLKDIAQFVLTQSGTLAAKEMAARVQIIKTVATRAGNVIDDPTAAKILGEIIASSKQLLPILQKTHLEIVRLGL
jgi:hypothetical protein